MNVGKKSPQCAMAQFFDLIWERLITLSNHHAKRKNTK
jgi:hypothetical protein